MLLSSPAHYNSLRNVKENIWKHRRACYYHWVTNAPLKKYYQVGLGGHFFLPDTGYPVSGRMTGYLGRKQTFCHKNFGTLTYYALGAQITAPNFGFLKKNKERNLCVSCLF